MREELPAILNALAAAAVLVVALLVDRAFPLGRTVAGYVGGPLLATGMLLVFWAAVHLKEAFLGEVQPRLADLVTTGPFQYVRHPVSLGFTIGLAGVAVILQSWPGLVGVLVVFLPSAVYRARLEERALDGKFGSAWRRYAARTSFMVPWT